MQNLENILRKIQPEKIIKKEFIAEYSKSVNLIWEDLIQLECSIFILNKISNFPFKYIDIPGHGNFFNIIVKNTIENVILIISRLIDKHRKSHSFNWIRKHLKNWALPNFQPHIDEVLESLEHNNELQEIRNRIKKIRNKRLAHVDLEVNIKNIDKKALKITLRELTNFTKSLSNMFDLICFGHHKARLPLGYDSSVTIGGKPVSSDIEEILLLVARTSIFINKPENYEYWEEYRKRLKDDELKILNEWREKLGLCKV